MGRAMATPPSYGGEAGVHGAEVVGRLRSCAYRGKVGRNVGIASLSVELGEGTELQVEVFGGSGSRPAPAPDVLVGADGKVAA